MFEELERLLGEFEAVVPEPVLIELDRLADSGTPGERTAASVGADLARERCTIRKTDSDFADDAVVELATKAENGPVVTNDGPLRERLLDAGVSVVSLRGTNKLAITQP